MVCKILAALLVTTSLSASYLEELESQGYTVIPNVISTSEAECLYTRVWHEYIEKAWPECKMDDRSNWKKAFPMHNKVGIFAGYAGQIQVMWDIRQDPRIVDIFAKIWNTDDLIVSMDGLSVMCPAEIREGYIIPWPHLDQTLANPEKPLESGACPIGFVSESSLKSNPYTIQGQLLLEDSFESDGGFYCIPKSHLKFDELAPKLEAIAAQQLTPLGAGAAKSAYVKDYFRLNDYSIKHVTASKGSLILWDSRTVHWNQHASSDRIDPKVRMVCYVCYAPKARLTEAGRALRRQAFETGIATGHDPVNPMLMDTRGKGSLAPEYEKYLIGPHYIQPSPILTPIGKSLLGF